MQGYGSYYRNIPAGMMPKTLSEFRVAGLRDSAPPPLVRVFRANPDGTPGELLRIEQGFTYEDAKTKGSYRWGDLSHMSEVDGRIITNV